MASSRRKFVWMRISVTCIQAAWRARDVCKRVRQLVNQSVTKTLRNLLMPAWQKSNCPLAHRSAVALRCLHSTLATLAFLRKELAVTSHVLQKGGASQESGHRVKQERAIIKAIMLKCFACFSTAEIANIYEKVGLKHNNRRSAQALSEAVWTDGHSTIESGHIVLLVGAYVALRHTVLEEAQHKLYREWGVSVGSSKRKRQLVRAFWLLRDQPSSNQRLLELGLKGWTVAFSK